MALALLVSGCALWPWHDRPVAELRIHLEGDAGSAASSQAISVMRSQPVLVNIVKEPLLTEADIVSAQLIETPGGFALDVKFDELGGWALEQNSAANPGRHLAIFAQWSDKPAEGRWLAAPLIARRIASRELAFTPDASREEMEQLVKGLSDIAKKNAGIRSKE